MPVEIETTNTPPQAVQERRAMSALRWWRLLLPVGLGIGVACWLIWRDFDPTALQHIQWTSRTGLWLGSAAFFAAGRHFFAMARLRQATHYFFGWGQSFMMVLLLEFCVAVMPTSAAGGAVSIFFIIRFGLTAGRTAAFLLYTTVLDSLLFLIVQPIAYATFGPTLYGPALYLFWPIFALLGAWGLALLVGLFVIPDTMHRWFGYLAAIPLLRRARTALLQFADDLLHASYLLRRQPWQFHLRGLTYTIGIWSCRFAILICLLHALLPNFYLPAAPTEPARTLFLLARQQAMHLIMELSPVPGGAGLAEYAFSQFHSDYIPGSLVNIVALPWRFYTYYLYLLVGGLLLPTWVQRRLLRPPTH